MHKTWELLIKFEIEMLKLDGPAPSANKIMDTNCWEQLIGHSNAFKGSTCQNKQLYNYKAGNYSSYMHFHDGSRVTIN